MKIIGFTGRAGAGKDTCAEIVKRHYNAVSIAFADPLRSMLLEMVPGLQIEDLTERGRKEQPIQWLGRSPRQLLQTLGTEWGRQQVCDDVWVRILERRIERMQAVGRSWGGDGHPTVQAVLITDVRFDNEARWITEQGGEVWEVVRPDLAPVARHASEAGVDDDHIARLIANNGDMSVLEYRVLLAARATLGEPQKVAA
jgi:hypothetical protein